MLSEYNPPLFRLILAIVLACLAFAAWPAMAQTTVTVTNTNNSGAGSLRQAITDANANSTLDIIQFAIPGTGPHVIGLTSNLPIITDSGVTIDATTQSGTACNAVNQGVPHDLRVELRRTSGDISGFLVLGANVTIRGISITGMTQRGITVGSGTSGFTLDCSYVGISADNVTVNATAAASSMTSAVGIGAINSTISNSVISGNAAGTNDMGIFIASSATNMTITGNLIGLLPDGVTAAPNGGNGISTNAASVTIGGFSTTNRNIISANGFHGISVFSGSSNVSIFENYIGVSADGTTFVPNSRSGIYVDSSSNVIIGFPSRGNVIAGTSSSNSLIFMTGSSDVTVWANKLGTNASGTSALGSHFSSVSVVDSNPVSIGGGTSNTSNIITGGTTAGVSVFGTSRASIIVNSIYGNVGPGIDLRGATGVDTNDAGDGDSGPNDLLNYPVINSVGTGATQVSYDFNLDVPANTDGYRIDFYKNPAADSSGNGEGETWLGSVDVNHTGGDINFTGNLTVNAPVTATDVVVATATRLISSGFDVTSEFSAGTGAIDSGQLTVEITSEVYDPTTAGLFNVPQNDRLMTATVSNETTMATTTDSIFLIIDVPDDAEFYNGDVDDTGPETNPVSFDGSNAPGLTFTYANDVRFSDSVTRPTFAACSYTPSAGYDPDVRFVCINPKGTMATGNPDPNFAVSFRQRIR